MIYEIMALIAAIGGLFAWIWKIITENRQLKESAAIDKATSSVKEWSDKIKDVDKTITEQERDYAAAKAEFEKNNPSNTPNK